MNNVIQIDYHQKLNILQDYINGKIDNNLYMPHKTLKDVLYIWETTGMLVGRFKEQSYTPPPYHLPFDKYLEYVNQPK